MTSGILYVVALILLALGQGIALGKHTDRNQPLTHYIRAFRNWGPLGLLLTMLVWLWLGWHYLIDFDGSLPL